MGSQRKGRSLLQEEIGRGKILTLALYAVTNVHAVTVQIRTGGYTTLVTKTFVTETFVTGGHLSWGDICTGSTITRIIQKLEYFCPELEWTDC